MGVGNLENRLAGGGFPPGESPTRGGFGPHGGLR